MSRLLNLIGKYSSKLSIIPIITLLLLAITFIISHYVKKRKFPKYIPSLILLLLGILIGTDAIKIFTTDKGLNLARVSVFLGTPALIGIFVCFIIDLSRSIKRNSKEIEGKRKNG